ncbi:PTS sugar transporter subunit IIB [Facklamia sp. 7083-14-GEN3]|uniref:PTS system mannose/fructose/N-acetylgalactosamine-transporter subunit IIB n=1 Tax=Facklamia sp. 7083-14-GEN3 TaxID=2973478 RepID=UPI00215B8252|nr:PTS sugar transporter subunit IIB [Facklamia sp. 7083-14-GEN3]MCR8969074.1 PTS sugar transporter subunit IIB [Facklamia sp. 7083-14-GEN3]
MGKVILGRVDERLIHGQVMITLSQKEGINSIFVVDEGVANDKFMRDLYRSAGSRTGQKTIVITPDKALHYWEEFNFKDYNCILLTKSVGVMHELITRGIEVKELNIGGVAQKNPEKDLKVTKSVYLNKEDAIKLKELNEEYGVENIYFQATPSAPKTDLPAVLKNFEL